MALEWVQLFPSGGTVPPWPLAPGGFLAAHLASACRPVRVTLALGAGAPTSQRGDPSWDWHFRLTSAPGAAKTTPACSGWSTSKQGAPKGVGREGAKGHVQLSGNLGKRGGRNPNFTSKGRVRAVRDGPGKTLFSPGAELTASINRCAAMFLARSR